MRTDSLQQFINLHRDLTQERHSLQARLRQINEALGDMQGIATTPASPAPARPAGRGRPPVGGGKSLKAHVIEVLQREGPMTKDDILDAVQRRGYHFTTSNPANSLGVILYGKNPKFGRVDGKFSLGGNSGGTRGGRRGRKNSLSPEARERIAAAQRKRWAAAGKAKGKSAAGSTTAGKQSRRMSPAARARIAEAARKRWAAAKAAGKTRL